MRLSIAQARKLGAAIPDDVKDEPSKFYSQKTGVDGRTFHSKKEADRYRDLRLLEAGGEISELKLQVPFVIVVNGIRITKYIADFTYIESGLAEVVVEDAKGFRTPEYKLKKRMMFAVFGIIIRET